MIGTIVDLNDNDLSDQFLLDCCLKIERISGNDYKLALCLRDFPHFQDFDKRLQAAGVGHTLDSSVFNPASPDTFKIIDFSTCDMEMLPN